MTGVELRSGAGLGAGKEIEKACQGIYPLQNVHIRKVKVLRAPKFDLTKLMEVHGDYAVEDVGSKIATTTDTPAEPIVGGEMETE